VTAAAGDRIVLDNPTAMFWSLMLGAGLAALAGKAALVVWQQSRRPHVLCLMYHRLARRRDCKGIQGVNRHYTVAVEELEAQVSYLKKEGFRFLTADEASRFARGKLALEKPAVMLTFDDGCVSVFEAALPVLQRHSVPATAFITTDPASYVFGYGQRRMSYDELRGVERAGVRCESHGVTHRPLLQLSNEELTAELITSKSELQEVLGREIKFLSAPGNWIDRRVVRLAKQAGYEAIWVSEPGAVRPDSNPFGLPRLNVDGTATLDQFAASMTPWGVAQRNLVYTAKLLPKRLAGPRLWYSLRSRLLPWVPGGYLSFARWRLIVTVPVIFLALVILLKALSR
jgi:peptidoglycan/xylan/chitin deacetylase (PgdA/CDA1 family)